MGVWKLKLAYHTELYAGDGMIQPSESRWPSKIYLTSFWASFIAKRYAQVYSVSVWPAAAVPSWIHQLIKPAVAGRKLSNAGEKTWKPNFISVIHWPEIIWWKKHGFSPSKKKGKTSSSFHGLSSEISEIFFDLTQFSNSYVRAWLGWQSTLASLSQLFPCSVELLMKCLRFAALKRGRDRKDLLQLLGQIGRS